MRHPWLALAHMLPGLVFLALAPLQFIARIRRRNIGLHRALGRVLVACAGLSGIAALAVNVHFPAFGGVTTQTATLFFGVLFLFSLVKAVGHIRRREVPLHREWMIRTFALAMGVATIRVVVALFMALSRYTFEEVFGTSFWLGFGINLVIAEVWIDRTRSAGAS